MSDLSARLSQLPKIDEVLRRPELAHLGLPRWAVVEGIRREVAARRGAIMSDALASPEVSVERILEEASRLSRPSLRRVINATGVVLHTNLGRAPLPRRALAAVADQLAGYTNLEYQVSEGRRGSRHDHLRSLLEELTGAEDAVVVNNNAAAVMLALAAIGTGREVVVSRGELVEIGGAFRIPEVCELSGALLVEVGTTNKTRAADYERARSASTAAFLKVHHSNFAIVGFTEEASVAELVALGLPHGIPTIMDLGSGALDRRMLDEVVRTRIASPHGAVEPTVAEVLDAGAALVCFSCDKLLGGPQAGIIAGAREHIAKVRKHPFMRAMRPDKLTIAALAETLAIYREGAQAQEIPTVSMLMTPAAELRERAEQLCAEIRLTLEQDEPGAGPSLDVSVVETMSAVGGGSLPLTELPSFALALVRGGPSGPSAADLDNRLRAAPVAVIGRIAEHRLLLDVRTLADDADRAGVVAAIKGLIA